MTTRTYTNKIESVLGEKVALPNNVLPSGVALHEVEIIFWPDYKPRGRAAKHAS